MIPPYQAIQTLYDTRLSTLSDLPIIIKENAIGFLAKGDENSPLTEKYIRTSIIPRETTDLSIGVGGCDNFGGLFLVEIFTPTGNGISETNYWVDEIIDLFAKDEILTDGTIIANTEQYTRLPGQAFTNYHKSGVHIAWSSYVPR